MELPFAISQAQLTEMRRPRQEKQRDQMLLEMAAFWTLNEEQWRARFIHVPAYEERKLFFGQVYDWGVQIGLPERWNFTVAGVMLLRAVCHGWLLEDIRMAQGFIEADATEPEAALKWLIDAFEE